MAEKLTLAEFQIRRYQAKLDFWKVVLGTMVVGIAAAFFPAIVDAYSSFFENRQKELQLQLEGEKFKLEQQKFYQKFIETFADEGYNQDIELRIRLAYYFSMVADGGYASSWAEFYEELVEQRDNAYIEIDKLIAEIAGENAKETPDVIRLSNLSNQLSRLNRRIGYVEVVLPDTKGGEGAQPKSGAEPQKVRAASRTEYLAYFGNPGDDLSDICTGPDRSKVNDVISSQLDTKEFEGRPVTLNKAALADFSDIIDEIRSGDKALYDSIGYLAGFCPKLVRGGNTPSGHTFGFEIDLTFLGQFPSLRPGSNDAASDAATRAAEFFTRRGWSWGGHNQIREGGHFGVGSELLKEWVDAGLVRTIATGSEP